MLNSIYKSLRFKYQSCSITLALLLRFKVFLLDFPISHWNLKGRYTLHCLIFKMLFSLVGELFYYTTFSFVCQPLFQKFFKLFCGSLSRFRSSFNIISLSKLFVKYFFKFFSKNFFGDRQPLADQLFYCITSSSFCQPLFRSFFKIFFL